VLTLAEIYYRNVYEVALSTTSTFNFSLQNYKTNTFFETKFAIITAGNPNNIDLPSEENRARNRELYSRLNSSALLNVRGCYLEHCEDGYLIYNIALEAALVLGREYEQVAIFYNDSKNLMYVDCKSESVISERAVD